MYIRKQKFKINAKQKCTSAIESLVVQLCQTQSLGPEGYTPVSNSNKQFVYTDSSKKLKFEDIKKPEKSYINLSNIYNLEKKIALAIGWSTYRAIVFTGALGSGKTATSNEVLRYIKENISPDEEEICINNCKVKSFECVTY
ncbi:MAG: hypothetical protein K8S16_14730 [Bacteroidales bacterium]|nr:hypothetical protein [Bacteroidales bacterium]